MGLKDREKIDDLGNVPKDWAQGICWAGNRELGSQTLTKGLWEALELES